jgi:hypothetical protein
MYGPPNPDGYSSYLPGEEFMNHNDRKSFMLPCGKTIAQSWAALRKAWLGFKIAFSNGDTALMTQYALFITKVQTEMGIQVTNFDSTILDEQALDEISRSCFYKKQPETRASLEERNLDYDSVMEKAHTVTSTKSLNISPPRQNIFDKPKNSCWYPPQEKKNYPQPKIVNVTRNTDTSCMWESVNAPRSNGEEEDRSCWHRVPGSGDELPVQEEFDRWDADEPDEDQVDPSCYYKVPSSGIETQSQEAMDLQGHTSIEENEEGRESSRRRSCFYKISR